MSISADQAAMIEATGELSEKIGHVLNFEDLGLSLTALADTAAVIIHGLDDPETARNLFVALLDETLDQLTFMPQELRR